MRGITVAYYATMLVVAVGLTTLLGYEVGWLFAHSRPSLEMAGIALPWVIFLAWTVSKEG
jgi:hypothetical protein